jgi:hypothetical protein
MIMQCPIMFEHVVAACLATIRRGLHYRSRIEVTKELNESYQNYTVPSGDNTGLVRLAHIQAFHVGIRERDGIHRTVLDKYFDSEGFDEVFVSDRDIRNCFELQTLGQTCHSSKDNRVP